MTKREFLTVSLLFLFLTLVFFYKIFQGKIPLPTDIIVGGYYPWYENIPVKNPKLSDAISIFYPLKILAFDYIKKGEFPFWNPHMFAGYPLYVNPTIGLFFPTSIFYLLFSGSLAWTLQTMSQPFIASFFMYLFLRHIKRSPSASFFGGIVYGFGGATILWVEWNTQAATTMFLPILILLEDKYLKSKNHKYGVFLSIFICIQILAGYLPALPMTFMVMAAWYIFFYKNYFSNLKILIFVFLGIGLSAFFTVPLIELIFNSQRTVENLGLESPFLLPQNLVNIIAPDFFGNDATYNYWGKGDHMDATIYAGLIALIFAVTAVSDFRKNKHVKFSILLVFLTLLISIQSPISQLLHDFGTWGGTSITMNRVNFIFNFSIAMLASIGLSRVKLKPAVLILSLIVVLAGALLASKIIFRLDAKTLININVSIRNLIWPSVLAALALISVYMSKKFRKISKYSYFIFALILIIDLFRFGWKFNAFSDPEYLYPENPVSDFLKNHPNDRFAAEKDIFPANTWVPHGLSSLAGYDSIYPYYSAKLIAVANSGDIYSSPQTRWGIINNLESPILRASNTRFLLTLEDKNVQISEIENSLPRAYMTEIAIEASDEEALASLLDENFQIDKISITDKFSLEPGTEDRFVSAAVYKSLSNSKILVNTNANKDALLVVLDSFYPGWKVYVDGKEAKIYRTNYLFRGVFIEKGAHEVKFVFDPESFKLGIAISLACFAIIFLFFTKPFLNFVRYFFE